MSSVFEPVAAATGGTSGGVRGACDRGTGDVQSRACVVPLDPASYRAHALHGADRAWPETNCYTDLLIEVVHAMGHEPLAMLGFTLAMDFEGDQWTFFKPSHADLLDLYGLDVQELAIWRPLVDHVEEQARRGRLALVEVDAFYLPDTAGTAYRREHVKTTVGVNRIDLGARHLGYFHNAGYFELEGEDFAQLFQLDGAPHARVLPPYVEMLKPVAAFERLPSAQLAQRSRERLRQHVRRIPASNPFEAFKRRFARDLEWLRGSPLEAFHAYSFANLRQYGACFGLAASHLQWLATQGVQGLAAAGGHFEDIATTAKNLQFQLARAMARQKALDLSPVDAMAAAWQQAMDSLAASIASAPGP
ncbi:MAG TPA: DUF1839 family protein [Usitatibacter sp.]|nr:DUF1839 family protein [Usitatibacter sp.]